MSQLAAGAMLAFLLYQFARRMPWPRPFRLSFALLNVGVAIVSFASLRPLSMAIESLFTGSLSATRSAGRVVELSLFGLLLYAIVAGITYASDATTRAARAEALASRTQLAALRAQVHPHFLFNALHAVVQLIPIDPARAAAAAELVASLLRTALEDDRDEVPLRDEWAFVSRYLQVEGIRLGERLQLREELDPALFDACVPSFAVQTLVENAVRHGAALRSEPTEIVVTAAATPAMLTVTVRNAAPSSGADEPSAAKGTGLARLRERLRFLHGDAASLTVGPRDGGVFEAILTVPRSRAA